MYESRSPDTSIPIFLINHKLCSYSTGQNSQTSSKTSFQRHRPQTDQPTQAPDGKRERPSIENE